MTKDERFDEKEGGDSNEWSDRGFRNDVHQETKKSYMDEVSVCDDLSESDVPPPTRFILEGSHTSTLKWK